ncbi:hypothetical protein BcDW1_5771 [Botrytis cinerea BcDW1]|uniref:Uncharacterized protein n=1 Tax=Botryotinia fuckeliana (strain BcDW1) TaxID=1290391 RepID=M7TPP2_BOTF1|nr:hypothetical protein BcDW1_5771 [Botrytis cinerea BcDW1]
MSTLTPPEDQPIKARSKFITPSQPQNATQLLNKTFGNILQVSSPPKSKSMNNLDPHLLVVMQVKNKHGDKYGRMESQEYLNKAGAIIVRDFGSQESLDDLRKAKNKITKRKVRFADSGYFDGSRDAEENMFDCEVDL